MAYLDGVVRGAPLNGKKTEDLWDEAQGRGAEGSRWENNSDDPGGLVAHPFLLQDLMEIREGEKRGESEGT